MKFIILFLLFLLPLFYLPYVSQQFEAPKAFLAEILIVLWFGLSIWQNKFRFPKKRLILIPLSILFFLNLLSLFNLNSSFFGNVFRLQGGLLFLILIILSLLSFSEKSVFTKENSSPFIALFSLFLLFISTFLFGQNKAGLIVGSLGEANALASISVILFGFTLFSHQKLILSTPVAASLSVYILFVTHSRSALLAFFIVIFIYSFKRFSLKVLALLSLLLIFSSLSFPFIESGGWYENRSDIWKVSFSSGLESPIFGHGFGNIETSLNNTATRLDNNVQYQIVDSSHNFLLDYWVSGGILALGAILTLIALTIIHFIRDNRHLELALFLGIIAIMSFNPVSVVIFIWFWYLIGQGFYD